MQQFCTKEKEKNFKTNLYILKRTFFFFFFAKSIDCYFSKINFLFRDGMGAAELRQTGSKKMHVLQLDVTNQEDWSKVKQYIEKNIPTTANGNIFLVNFTALTNFPH